MSKPEGGEAARQRAIRDAVKAVYADASLSAAEKQARIRDLLHSHHHAEAGGGGGAGSGGAGAGGVTPEQEEADRQPTRHGGGELGCKHYVRGAKMRAPCCGRLFACRLCHDEESGHEIDRHAVKSMMCMACGAEQQPAQACGSCGEVAGAYFCAVCNFWDSDPTHSVFHCDKCGICRRGRQEEYFHCDQCGVCLSVACRDNHKCTERSLEGNCSVCSEFLFTSTRDVSLMACGHSIHRHCFVKYQRSPNGWRCPICRRALSDMSAYYGRLRLHITAQPMPPEYDGWQARVLCNDCSVYSVVPFHFLGHACNKCLGYNTELLDKAADAAGLGSAKASDLPYDEDKAAASLRDAARQMDLMSAAAMMRARAEVEEGDLDHDAGEPEEGAAGSDEEEEEEADDSDDDDDDDEEDDDEDDDDDDSAEQEEGGG